jgi:hypothetical protein
MPVFHHIDYGFDSHGRQRSFFQESVIVCNFISLFATTRNYQNILTLKYTRKSTSIFLEQTGYNASKLYAKYNENLYIIEERCVCP